MIIFYIDFFIYSISLIASNSVILSLKLVIVPLYAILIIVGARTFRVNLIQAVMILLIFIVAIIAIFLKLSLALSAMYVYYIAVSVILYKNRNEFDSLSVFTYFINSTYFLFVILSILAMMEVIPGINQLVEKTPFGEFPVFTGLGGSTATIDTYSVVVFLYNFLLSKNKLVAFISLLIIILTLRLTPVVTLMSVLILAPLFKRKLFSMIVFISITLSFLIAIPLSTSPEIKYVGDLATHGRITIWSSQLNQLFNNFKGLSDVFSMGHIDFYFSYASSNIVNSHNTYLSIFRKSILLYFVIMTFLYYYTFKYYNYKHFIVIYGVLIGGMTNSQIFDIYNPIYLLVIVGLYIIRRQEFKQQSTEISDVLEILPDQLDPEKLR